MLTPVAPHRKVFPEVPIVGFKRGKICWLGRKFQWKKKLMGSLVVVNKEGSDTYKIKEGLHLACNSENAVYLIACKKCKKQYVGSCITTFRASFNNYRSCHRKFCRGHSVIQVSFHAHFMLDGHCGIDGWEIILIEKGRNKQETRTKELFWQYKLDTCVPHGLNE